MSLDDLWTPLNDETLKEIKDCGFYLVDWENDNNDPHFQVDCPIIAQARHIFFPEYKHKNGEIDSEGWYWVFECFPLRTNELWQLVYGEKEFCIKGFIELSTYTNKGD